MNPYFLFVTIALPFIGGIASYFMRGKTAHIKNTFLFIIVLCTTALTWLCVIFRPDGVFTLFSLTDTLRISFQLDGLGSFFACLVASLWPFAMIYSFEYMKNEKQLNVFYMFYTLTFGTTLGIAMSENLLTMYFFYELLTLVTLPLVIHPMTKKSSKAGRTYLYLSLAGSAFAFIGLVLLISNTGSAEFVLGGIMNGKADNLNIFIYFLTFMGFGVKAVIFPVHIWLPQTTVAPTPVTALLHAVVVVKSGVFAIIRITYYNYGADYLRGTWAQTVCLIIVIFTILFGSVMSVKERHFKRRLAYSTISNLSYVLFGALLMTTAGFAAALLHMLFHAIIKICAFFCTGNVKYMTEREYCFQLDGLGKKMPLTFAAFTISAFALTGVPLFCGFVSKWQLCTSATDLGGTLPVIGVVVLIISALLTAIYMFSIVVRAYFCKGENLADVKEAPLRMILPLCVFAAFMIFFGIFSQPILSLVTDIASGIF